jgi:hypothetical protein
MGPALIGTAEDDLEKNRDNANENIVKKECVLFVERSYVVLVIVQEKM